MLHHQRERPPTISMRLSWSIPGSSLVRQHSSYRRVSSSTVQPPLPNLSWSFALYSRWIRFLVLASAPGGIGALIG